MTDASIAADILRNHQQQLDVDWEMVGVSTEALNMVLDERDAQAARIAELEAALNTILAASDFYSQTGTDGMTSRYAHESNCRLIRAALKGTDHD